MFTFAERKALLIMTFDDITKDGRLWAVRYDEAADKT